MAASSAAVPAPPVWFSFARSSSTEKDKTRATEPDFDLGIAGSEPIAVGGKIREIERLRKVYGRGRWRKMKGIALVRLPDGTTSPAEVHWYESHGIGRKEIKIKRLLGIER